MHEPGPAPSACSGVRLRNICSDGTWQLVSERLLMSHVQMHISNQLSQTHSCSLRRALTRNSIRWLSQTLGLSRGGEGERGSEVNKCWGFFFVFEILRAPLMCLKAESNSGFFIEPTNTTEAFSQASKLVDKLLWLPRLKSWLQMNILRLSSWWVFCSKQRNLTVSEKPPADGSEAKTPGFHTQERWRPGLVAIVKLNKWCDLEHFTISTYPSV